MNFKPLTTEMNATVRPDLIEITTIDNIAETYRVKCLKMEDDLIKNALKELGWISPNEGKRLREALVAAVSVFDEMDGVAWHDKSDWQISSYEETAEACRAALNGGGE